MLARAYGRSHGVRHIDLHDLVTVPGSGIGHADADPDPVLPHRFAVQAVIGEFRITQTVAEGVQGRRRHVHIVRGLGERLVVIDRQLAHRARHGHGQASGGIVVSEEHVGNRLAARLAGIELRQDGIRILTGPALVQRPAFDIDDHHRRPRRMDGLEQVHL